MPHSTLKYGFEWKVLHWAGSFSRRLTGNGFYSFFIAFSDSGRAKRVVFGNKPEEPIDPNGRLALQETEYSWFCFDPFEGPEHTCVAWRNVKCETMERVMDARFEPDDFERHVKLIAFPVTWSFMS